MVFTDNELVLYKQNGKTYSGGFTVNSLMMQHGISPIISGGGGGGGGGSTKTDETFHNLAIPAGLYYFDGGLEQKGGAKNATYVNEEEYLSDELYSRLMELAGNVQGSTNEEPDKKEGKEGKEGKHKRTKKQRLLQENKKRKTKKH